MLFPLPDTVLAPLRSVAHRGGVPLRVLVEQAVRDYLDACPELPATEGADDGEAARDASLDWLGDLDDDADEERAESEDAREDEETEGGDTEHADPHGLRSLTQPAAASPPRVVHPSGLTAEEVREGVRLEQEDFALPLPATRGECRVGPRPCPHVRCRYHLAVDVKRNGRLLLNHPGVAPDELHHTCALDIAETYDAGVAAEAIGRLLNITRQRATQIIVEAKHHFVTLAGFDIEEALREA